MHTYIHLCSPPTQPWLNQSHCPMPTHRHTHRLLSYPLVSASSSSIHVKICVAKIDDTSSSWMSCVEAMTRQLRFACENRQQQDIVKGGGGAKRIEEGKTENVCAKLEKLEDPGGFNGSIKLKVSYCRPLPISNMKTKNSTSKVRKYARATNICYQSELCVEDTIV